MTRDQIIDILVEHRGEMEAWGAGHLYDSDLAHWDVITDETEQAFAVVSRAVDDNTPIDLEMFLVLPEARGKGIGKAFIKDIAKEYGRLGGECYTEAQALFYERSGCRVSRYKSMNPRFFISRVDFQD